MGDDNDDNGTKNDKDMYLSMLKVKPFLGELKSLSAQLGDAMESRIESTRQQLAAMFDVPETAISMQFADAVVCMIGISTTKPPAAMIVLWPVLYDIFQYARVLKFAHPDKFAQLKQACEISDNASVEGVELKDSIRYRFSASTEIERQEMADGLADHYSLTPDVSEQVFHYCRSLAPAEAFEFRNAGWQWVQHYQNIIQLISTIETCGKAAPLGNNEDA